MKTTGIVRRVDDLGRIVIPKEIRRTLHIKEGDAMEIYLDNNDTVCFKKYYGSWEYGEATIDLMAAIRDAMDDMYITEEDKTAMSGAIALLDQVKTLLLNVGKLYK